MSQRHDSAYSPNRCSTAAARDLGTNIRTGTFARSLVTTKPVENISQACRVGPAVLINSLRECRSLGIAGRPTKQNHTVCVPSSAIFTIHYCVSTRRRTTEHEDAGPRHRLRRIDAHRDRRKTRSRR